MLNNYNILIKKLNEFINKYYKNELLKGVLYTLSILVTAFITIVVIEYKGYLNSFVRGVFFYGYLLLFIAVLLKYIVFPVVKLLHYGNTLTYEQAANIIGNHFQNIQDKLINVLELSKMAQSTTQQNELLLASIDQKITELKPIPFHTAIDFSQNKKYLKYAIPPVFIVLLIWFFSPEILTEGSARVINYDKKYMPKAPFEFVLQNKNLNALENEDFEILLSIEGKSIPNLIFIETGTEKYIMTKKEKNLFSYTVKNIQKETNFRFTTNQYFSDEYTIKVTPNPTINNFKIYLDYPNYTQIEDKTINNVSEFVVPEGTKIKWEITTQNVDNVSFICDTLTLPTNKISTNNFSTQFLAKNSFSYQVVYNNSYVKKKPIKHYVSVIKDQYPGIDVSVKIDSTNFKKYYFKGLIKDDYGFSKLVFHYNITNDSNQTKKVAFNDQIPINTKATQDQFFYYWDLSTLNLTPGTKLYYYFEIWDNDAVNGSKSVKSEIKTVAIPTLDELKANAEKSNQDLKKELKESISKAKNIQEQLKSFKQKMIDKKELSWEDKEQLKQVLQEQKELEKKINEINQQNQLNVQQQEEYLQQSQEILEKQEKLQELFEELMTDEMKQLFEKLQELMDKLDKNALEQSLENLELDNKELEKELDRSLELFKQLEMDQKLEQTQKELEKLAEEQEKLAAETENKTQSNEKLKERQDKLNDRFEKLKEDVKKLNELNKELENKRDIPETDQQEQEIEQEMQKSTEELDKGKNKKASQSQKKAAEQMKSMAAKMQQAQSQQSSGEDINSLRQILDNLVHLSFEQEALMETFKQTKRTDPTFVKLVQQQQKIKEDSKVIEDSLFALSKRIVQLESKINREISDINANIEKTLNYLAEPKMPTEMAISRQQYVMTSYNNLALLLDEIVQQLQAQMRSQKAGKGSCNNPGGMGQPKPTPGIGSIKKMQDQLNQQLQQLKEAMEKGQKPGQKPGNGMSKSLAKAAAQQAKLRQQLQKLSNDLKNNAGSGKGLNNISKLMEETETDLVNKRITNETLKRQQEILTRLLEHEKAEREREYDDKRKSEEAKQTDYKKIEQMFKFDTTKEQELELLRTTPPSFNIFYKNKVTDYFQNIQQ
ncbi:MAG: ATPase [Vicingaceae bacterium]